MHGRGAYKAGGMHGRGGMHGGGCVWQRAYVAGGACVAGGRAWQGDVHGKGACMAGGWHAWKGACMAEGCAWQILQDMVNERVVRILLECILVNSSLITQVRVALSGQQTLVGLHARSF